MRAHLKVGLVPAPRAGTQVLQQRALVGEGEVEGQVAAVLPVAHLPQEVLAGGGDRLRRLLPAARNVRRLPLLHLAGGGSTDAGANALSKACQKRAGVLRNWACPDGALNLGCAALRMTS